MLRASLKPFLLVSLLGFLNACGGSDQSASLQAIDVTPAAASAAAGSASQLTATGMFSDGSHADITNQVTWTTSNAAVATVSSVGVATAVAVGGATVTATLQGVAGSATYTVTAAVLKSIEVTPPILSIAAGRTALMTATGVYSDNSTQNLSQVTWTSSDSAVASVAADGVVTAVGVGSATITSTSGTISGSTTLTVTGAVLTTIQVTPATPSVAKGLTQQFSATGIFSDNSKQDLTSQVSWNSANTAVATIAASGGLATAVAVGSATISATVGAVTGTTTFTVTAALLTAIQVTPVNASLAKGLTRQFSATGVFTDNSTLDLTTQATWTSSNTAAATVSNAAASAGIVTAVLPGAATIAANLGSISGSTAVTVTPATLVSIQITPPGPSIPLGVTQQFTATGIYTDSTRQNLTTSARWSSSAMAVATISNAAGSQGLATPAAVGSTTIQATSGAVSGSTSLSVTPAALVSIQVTPAIPSVAKGLTQQFSATGIYTDNSTQNLTSQVTWMSGNSAVATISSDATSSGLASTTGTGTTTITAMFNVVTGTTTLTVTPAQLVSIAVTPAKPSIAKGLPQQFVATGTYTDQSTQVLTTSASIMWATDNATVATVSNGPSSKGLASTVGTGTATISAIAGTSGVSGSTVLTVTPAVIHTLVISPTSPSPPSGRTVQFTATGLYTDTTPPQDVTTLATWTSSNPNVATINPNTGLATASSTITSGQTTIQAAYNPGGGLLTASTTLTVTQATLDTITLAPVNPSVAAGLTQQFTATGHYSNGDSMVLASGVTWTSSDTNLAVVDPSSGLATGLKIGTPTISATQGSVSGSTTLNVTAPVLQSITVAQVSSSPTAPNIAFGSTAQYEATGNYSDLTTGPLTGPVTWASLDTSVATIDATGLAAAVAYGTATIQVTDNDSGKVGSVSTTVFSSFRYGSSVYNLLSTPGKSCAGSLCHSATGSLGPPSTVMTSGNNWTLYDSATSLDPIGATQVSITTGTFQVETTESPTLLVNPGDAASSTFYISLCGDTTGTLIGAMPQGEGKIEPSQCLAISQWINDGAHDD